MVAFDFSPAQAAASVVEGQQASVLIQSLLMQIDADAVWLVRTQFQQINSYGFLVTRRNENRSPSASGKKNESESDKTSLRKTHRPFPCSNQVIEHSTFLLASACLSVCVKSSSVGTKRLISRAAQYDTAPLPTQGNL